MKNFKTKKNSFIISVTSTLPSPLQPPLWTGPRVKHILLALFFLVVGSGSTLLPLPLFVLGFCQFGNILMHCAIVLQYAV